ncbi:MAG: hypothetical protein AB7G68_19180 [Nitrospiraceae bacterium]
MVRSFCALVSLLLLCQGGCTLVWHVSSPDIQPNAAAHLPADNRVAYRLAYRASELLEFASEKDASKFRKNIEAAIQRAGFHVIDERAAGKVLDIHVRQNLPSGGTPQEFVKRLTLGVIPTWTTHEGTFEFAMRLCEKNRPLARARYLISRREFTWILVLPLSWINLFRWDEVYELLGEAVESVLVEGTMRPGQEKFSCMDKSPGAFSR